VSNSKFTSGKGNNPELRTKTKIAAGRKKKRGRRLIAGGQRVSSGKFYRLGGTGSSGRTGKLTTLQEAIKTQQ